MYNLYMKCSIRRLLLVFILLVAIPFQGVASTLMFACEMSHGSTVADSNHSHDSQVSSHQHPDSLQVAHASFDGDGSSDLAKNNLDEEHHAFGSDVHKNHLKHNSCGSSTASGAVANTVLFLASSITSSTDFTYISSLHLPPVLAGLDRPPRLTLA